MVIPKQITEKQANKTSMAVRLANRDFERKIVENIKRILRLSLNMHGPKPQLNHHLDR